MTRITNHAGEKNFRATWALRQLSREDAFEALTDLLRSDEVIDRETRTAILEALEADKSNDRNAIRLRIVKPAHRPRMMVSDLELMERRQRIGREAESLLDAGGVEKNVIEDLAEKHRLAISEVRSSLSAWRGRKAEVRRVPLTKS